MGSPTAVNPCGGLSVWPCDLCVGQARLRTWSQRGPLAYDDRQCHPVPLRAANAPAVGQGAERHQEDQAGKGRLSLTVTGCVACSSEPTCARWRGRYRHDGQPWCWA